MRAGCPSSTSLLIARGLLLADASPALRPMLVPDSAALTRELLDAAGSSRWFDFALSHRGVRWAICAAQGETAG